MAIVGSGLSIPGGGPTWKELLIGAAYEAALFQPGKSDQVRKIVRTILENRFLNAADMLMQIMDASFQETILRQFSERLDVETEDCMNDVEGGQGKSPFKRCVRGEREMMPTLSHRYLSNLRFRAVITTNYDTLIEDAMPSDRRPYVPLARDYPRFSELLQRGDRFLLKIHGDKNEPTGIVIARSDYTKLLHGRETEGLRSALKSLFQTTIPVWIGYGHNDPTLDYYVDKGKEALGISNGFAIARSDDFELENRLKRSSIRLISLSDYDQVPAFLKRLAAACDCRIVFEVQVGIDEGGRSTQSWARRIGHDLAYDLNSRILSGEEVTFWCA